MSQISQVYDQIASDYASKHRHPDAKMKLASSYLKSGMRILDLGCGHGQFYELVPKDCQYVGLDFSLKLITLARQHYPKTEFFYGDMTDERVWQKLGFFDYIFSFASFHHLMSRKEQLKTLKLCHEHLKNKGLLIIVVWNLLKEKRKKVLKPWRLSDGQKVVKTVYRPYYAFNPEELKNLIQKAGFKVEKTFFVEDNKEFGLISTPGVAS